jgi:hypothetical protein
LKLPDAKSLLVEMPAKRKSEFKDGRNYEPDNVCFL